MSARPLPRDQKRAARLGFEFVNVQGLLKKVYEEVQELLEAGSSSEQFDEMGDLLFMVAKVARWLKIDAEEALRHANRKFRRRFEAMEEIIREEGCDPLEYGSEEWLGLWGRVKG